MASVDKTPKQTGQAADGRKDEKKGSRTGRKIADQSDLGNSQGTEPAAGQPAGGKAGQARRNSQGGQWGQHKGRGGQDSHNKR